MVMYIAGIIHRAYACVMTVTPDVKSEFQDIIVYVTIMYMFK